jgi:hypothetical protein
VSTFTPAVLSLDQDSRYADDEADALLAGSAEELGRLRFTIILIARWEQSNSLTPQRRKTFSEELSKLRALYLGMLDELGMAFGVQQATKTQEHVEVPSLFRRECCHHPTHASRDTVLKARCQQVFSLSGPHAVESDAQLHPTRSASPRPAARSKAGAFRGKQALSHAETLHPSSLFLLSSAEAESLRHPGPVADRSTFDPRFQTHTTNLISTCHSCSLN